MFRALDDLLVERSGNVVALAAAGLETLAVEYAHDAAFGDDAAGPLQHADGHGDGLSANPQKLGEVLVGDAQLLLADSILAGEQPAAHALTRGVHGVAGDGLIS